MTSKNDQSLAVRLEEIIDRFDCASGTLHRLEGDRLELIAHQGIPERVLDRIETIPVGKGMAGIAAKRREPVEVCNLQTDTSGVARPGAQETGMEGSIAAPAIAADDTLQGVVGIAKAEPYEFSARERDRLLQIGHKLARRSL